MIEVNPNVSAADQKDKEVRKVSLKDVDGINKTDEKNVKTTTKITHKLQIVMNKLPR